MGNVGILSQSQDKEENEPIKKKSHEEKYLNNNSVLVK